MFVYGSLIESRQRDFVVGRYVPSEGDVLKNYEKIAHPYFEVYPTIRPKDGELVFGKTFKVNDEELKRLDNYETSHYKKIEVTLNSGKKALAYTDVA